MIAPGGPYPLMCFAFGLIGFAQALQVAGSNGFVGLLKDPSTKLGFMHASYGMTENPPAAHGKTHLWTY